MLSLPPTRTPETERVYAHEGLRHRRRAARIRPLITCPVEALVVSFEADTATLRPRTVRRYRQEASAALDAMVSEDPNRAAAANAAHVRIAAALDRRRGRPPVPRTSTKKVRNPSAAECAAILADLRERAVAADATPLSVLLPDFVIVAPRLGLRPIEWIGTYVSGAMLTVRCAKTTNGRGCASHRPIGLARYGADFIAAVVRVVAHMPGMVDAYGSWERLRDAMAERLARSCVRLGQRRLSLYGFRHCAIATWKAAGLSAPMIAALAGHRTVAMQRGYAGARHGWEADTGLPQPDPALVTAIAARSAAGSVAPAIVSSVDQSDCPTPFEQGYLNRHQTARTGDGGLPAEDQAVEYRHVQPQSEEIAAPSTRTGEDAVARGHDVDIVTWPSFKARQAASIQRMLAGLERIAVIARDRHRMDPDHPAAIDAPDLPPAEGPRPR